MINTQNLIINKKVEIEELEQTTDQILNAQLTFDEIIMMINKFKSGKTAGIDKIIAELLKNLDDDTVIIIESDQCQNPQFKTGMQKVKSGIQNVKA